MCDLGSEEGRRRYRKLARKGASPAVRASSALFLARVAEWAPSGPWPWLFGVLLVAPAAYTLATGTDGFLELVMVDDPVRGTLTTARHGLSRDGYLAIGAGIAGVLVLAQAIIARFVRAVVTPDAAATTGVRGSAPRVFAAAAATDVDVETLEGRVRAAVEELPSPLVGEPCVLFGLEGDVDGAPIEDAEGGDFDLELASGERVMVSLEHARLVAAEPSLPPPVVEPNDTLEEVLERRGIPPNPLATARLRETIVRDGDRVTVRGRVSGGKALSLGYRTPSRVRVISGDAASPAVVQLAR